MSASLHVARHEIPYLQEILRLGAEQVKLIIQKENEIDTSVSSEQIAISKSLIDELAQRYIKELEDYR